MMLHRARRDYREKRMAQVGHKEGGGDENTRDTKELGKGRRQGKQTGEGMRTAVWRRSSATREVTRVRRRAAPRWVTPTHPAKLRTVREERRASFSSPASVTRGQSESNLMSGAKRQPRWSSWSP